MRNSIRPPKSAIRNGFTLVELLVAITIIGIMAGFVLSALQRANGTAKVAKTKSLIAKLNNAVMTKWESYRIRRPPVDSRTLLTGNFNPQTANAQAFIADLYLNRQTVPVTTDPLGVLPADPRYPTSAQMSATRLLAMRELQKLEMPSDWEDILNSASWTPGNLTRASLQVLLVYPALSTVYYNAVNLASNNPSVTQAQILANGPAECLYLIVTRGMEDNSLGAESFDMKDVGDVDGDGLLEFQDAFLSLDPGNLGYTPIGRGNNPIFWMRWPAAFVSELQPDSTVPNRYTFALDHHDPLDPLKLDSGVGPNGGGSSVNQILFEQDPNNTPATRGFVLTPLIYSPGPDGTYSIRTQATPGSIDPYAIEPGTGFQKGMATAQGWQDNITNHQLQTK